MRGGLAMLAWINIISYPWRLRELYEDMGYIKEKEERKGWEGAGGEEKQEEGKGGREEGEMKKKEKDEHRNDCRVAGSKDKLDLRVQPSRIYQKKQTWKYFSARRTTLQNINSNRLIVSFFSLMNSVVEKIHLDGTVKRKWCPLFDWGCVNFVKVILNEALKLRRKCVTKGPTCKKRLESTKMATWGLFITIAIDWNLSIKSDIQQPLRCASCTFCLQLTFYLNLDLIWCSMNAFSRPVNRSSSFIRGNWPHLT